jgi:hypothetical protein
MNAKGIPLGKATVGIEILFWLYALVKTCSSTPNAFMFNFPQHPRIPDLPFPSRSLSGMISPLLWENHAIPPPIDAVWLGGLS